MFADFIAICNCICIDSDETDQNQDLIIIWY